MAPNAVPNAVPKTHEVIPGAHVNIILKVDQPTGRQVRGTVRDVLTRGDHHRGIKVRLTDGRIGRVQSIVLQVGGDSATQPSLSSPFMNGPSPPPIGIHPFPDNVRPSQGQGSRSRHRDVRLDGMLDVAPEQMDLGAYIVPSRRKRKGRKGADANQPDEAAGLENGSKSNNNEVEPNIATAVTTCPVCEAFEGDETAIAHHIAEHFGD
ncbi:hypothetical protein F5Y19DRAFT_144451 [Xylariaceae sp. FL1651]|nr:hypothetical protein F5Y19DRAFT_144451 [Xylariaceae sp. FL1651]